MQMQLQSDLLYLPDANVLIDASRDYYPVHRVPEFWDWLAYLGEQGRVKVPQEVYEKVTEADDELANWLKGNRGAMLLSEEVNAGLVDIVIRQGYTEDLTDDEIEQLNEDPFLIAYALADIGQRCVVTTEQSRPSRQRANRHIPDVCDDFGVRCLHIFSRRNIPGLIDELDFSTDWNTRNI